MIILSDITAPHILTLAISQYTGARATMEKLFFCIFMAGSLELR